MWSWRAFGPSRARAVPCRAVPCRAVAPRARRPSRLWRAPHPRRSCAPPLPPVRCRAQISSVREVEDLLIRCIYGGLIEGKLDQQLKQLSVHNAAGRDIHPSEISSMLETLATWHDTSLAVLSSLDGNMQSYKAQCDDARASQTALTKKVALTAAP